MQAFFRVHGTIHSGEIVKENHHTVLVRVLFMRFGKRQPRVIKRHRRKHQVQIG